MSVFSGHDMLFLLAAPAVAGVVGAAVFLRARAQSRALRRRAAEVAEPQRSGVVARAASTTPAP